ncbi:General transcription factor 3C polypeptide 6 [Myotis brandtii]|uniref:General transcription factor 3C polypeptide 6 n=1 Tax=Myotis brandtii TaxID=109478 RepID=S7NLZ3_MYOBR|nr:General transcription factor 3C polypeptide 6 [Myotis brandtii]
MGTGAGLRPSSVPLHAPSRGGPWSPVCPQPRSHHHPSHALTAQSDWGQHHQQVQVVAAAPIAPQKQGEVEKPSGGIKVGSYRLHPLMAPSNWGRHRVLAAGVSGGSGTSSGYEQGQQWQQGIDTERPILQVDSYVFAGEYEDTLGTCVIFEENVEHVDAEGNNKTVLKYKCHTMKKLSMTRTLLTEKKEGEESIGGVEWLQIEDNDFSNRPNMICNFLHENEDEEVVAPAPDKPLELEEQNIQMKFNSNLSYEQEKPPHLEIEDSGPLILTPSETESSVFMETQDAALEITPR